MLSKDTKHTTTAHDNNPRPPRTGRECVHVEPSSRSTVLQDHPNPHHASTSIIIVIALGSALALI